MRERTGDALASVNDAPLYVRHVVIFDIAKQKPVQFLIRCLCGHFHRIGFVIKGSKDVFRCQRFVTEPPAVSVTMPTMLPLLVIEPAS